MRVISEAELMAMLQVSKMKTDLLLAGIAVGMVWRARQSWDALVDRFFDEAVFPFNPSAATISGFHQYDAMLEDYSRGGVG